MSTESPETSIVIRAFNEERWLPEVLRAIEKQTYRDYEIILVDSGSMDRTREIAEAAGARIIRLRSEDFTFGYSLNLGIREARGSLIAIISAHAIPTDEHWLERLVTPLRTEPNAMVFGGQRGHAVSKFSEARDFERVFPDKPQIMDDDHVFVNNANSAIRKDLWDIHPFDEGLPGLEDAEWAKYWIPLGKQVLYDPTACIYHVHTESWPQVRHRFHREGIAGRWTAVRIMRNIPGEILRESWWLVADQLLAAKEGKLFAEAGNIWRYRYNKTIGIVKGILDSRVITNPSKRSELYVNKGYGAVSIRGPHHAQIEPRSIPTLKPGQVLVRVAYTGICATDIEILEGRLGYYKTGQAKYPIVPGHESSGTIVSLGKKVTNCEIGDRVVVECIQGCGECEVCKRDDAIICKERREVGVMGIDGGYGEYVVSRARYVHKVPEGTTLAQAALAEPMAVSVKGLRRLGAVPGVAPHTVAVIGAGTIGHLTAKLLALRGHAVTVFDKEQARLQLLSSVAKTSTVLEGLDKFEWIVEATGSQDSLNAVLQQSSTGATLLLLGFPYATQEFTFESIVGSDKTVVGSVGSNGADFEDALKVLPQIDTTPFLQAAFPMEDYTKAWTTVRARSHIKVMLKVDANAV